MEGVKPEEKSFIRWQKSMEFGRRLGCHQLPKRSFFVKGWQMFVCARCFGVIVGDFVGTALFFLVHPPLLLSVCLLLPMAVDWGIQRLGILESTNVRRLLSGISGGVGLTFIYLRLIVLVAKIVAKVVSGF